MRWNLQRRRNALGTKKKKGRTPQCFFGGEHTIGNYCSAFTSHLEIPLIELYNNKKRIYNQSYYTYFTTLLTKYYFTLLQNLLYTQLL